MAQGKRRRRRSEIRRQARIAGGRAAQGCGLRRDQVEAIAQAIEELGVSAPFVIGVAIDKLFGLRGGEKL